MSDVAHTIVTGPGIIEMYLFCILMSYFHVLIMNLGIVLERKHDFSILISQRAAILKLCNLNTFPWSDFGGLFF